MTSKRADAIDGAGLDEADAERIRRVVAVLGKERAAALFEDAKARAASDGDPWAGAAPAETVARHFFDLVWEQADPAYVRWIFAPPEPPGPPIDESQDAWSPLLFDPPSGKLIGCLGVLAVAEHLFVGLVAVVSQAFQGFNPGGGGCDCLPSDLPPSKDWAYQPIVWGLWPLFLIVIVGLLVAAAGSQSEWRWTRWLTALLAPWAWLILVNVAFRVQVG